MNQSGQQSGILLQKFAGSQDVGTTDGVMGKVTAMCPEHPCTLLLGVAGTQAPDCTLPTPFLRLLFTVSSFEC